MKRSIVKAGNAAFLFILLNAALAAYATPVTDLGDAPDYIQLARSFLGYPTELNLAHRSPLYSIILAGFMLLFQPPVLYKAIVCFQYALLAFSSWMIYRLFRRVFSSAIPPLFIALLFNLSPATIAFSNIILTETVAVFLVVLSLWVLMKIYDSGKISRVLALGALVGLISLARYNAVPLIATYLVLLLVALGYRKAGAGQWVLSTGAFLAPYLLVINAWCLYNRYHNGFYGLFPHSGLSVSRNVVVASIRPDDTVSEANRPILDIFLAARTAYLQSIPPPNKGSLSKLDKYNVLPDLYGGYLIYDEALPQLYRYYGLPLSAGEHELTKRLSGFYREIIGQNQDFILKFRFVSMLSGFRAAIPGVLPPEYGNINLNILPGFVFRFYRFSFIGISLTVFLLFFFFAARGIKDGWRFDYTRLAMYVILFSFWGVNFVFVTTNDANRFKYPAEPFLIGLFVYYAVQVWNWLTERYRFRFIRRQPIADN